MPDYQAQAVELHEQPGRLVLTLFIRDQNEVIRLAETIKAAIKEHGHYCLDLIGGDGCIVVHGNAADSEG